MQIPHDSVVVLGDKRTLGSGYKLSEDNSHKPHTAQDLLKNKTRGCGTILSSRTESDNLFRKASGAPYAGLEITSCCLSNEKAHRKWLYTK